MPPARYFPLSKPRIEKYNASGRYRVALTSFSLVIVETVSLSLALRSYLAVVAKLNTRSHTSEMN